jgi:hypothetical protein
MADTIIDGFFDALGSGAFTMPVDLTPWPFDYWVPRSI